MKKKREKESFRLFSSGRHLFSRNFLLFLLFLPSLAFALEESKITVQLNKVTLIEALKEINRLSDNRVMYKREEVELVKTPVTVNLSEVSLLEAVQACLPVGHLTAVQRGDIVVVAPENASQKQTVVIRGVVLDTQKLPLPGVTVMIKGSTSGTVTGSNGEFNLELPAVSGEIVLQFSFIGMVSQEVAYKGEALRVIMKEDVQTLTDVVVTGMFTKPRESYTGAVTTITSQELKRSGSRNLLTTIKNVDPAFNIVEDINIGSDPNALPSITIRGNSSLDMSVRELQSENRNTPNMPLFIMDGFQVNLQRVMDLDQNIVESMTILKDAAATSIYGTRGANGVVVITTRRPEGGRLLVSYRGSVNVEAPDLRSYNLMNAKEKLRFEKLAGLYDYLRADEEQTMKELYNRRMIDAERGVNTYWLKYPVRTGVGTRHNLRLEGGREEFRFAANLGYDNIEGAMKGSSRNTLNGDVFISYEVSRVKFQNRLAVTFNKAQNSPYGEFRDFARVNAYWKPYDDEGNLLMILESSQYYPGMPNWGSYNTVENPLWNALLPSLDDSRYTEIQNNFNIDWQVIPKLLRLEAGFSYKHKNERKDNYISSQHTKYRNYSSDDYSRKGEYTYTTGESSGYQVFFRLNYSQLFDDKHQLYAGLNAELSQDKDELYRIKAEGISNIHMDYLGMATLYEKGGRPYAEEGISRRVGAVLNVNYTYNRRYYVDITGTLEGSSKFGSDNRTAPFGSIGFGWNVSNEAFLQDNPVLTRANLRVSYGSSGSQDFSPYQAITSFKDYGNKHYNNWYGFYLLGMGNRDLGWQTTYTLNVGTDLEFYNNRFSLTVDVYRKLTDDLLSDITLPSAGGFSSYRANVGQVLNTGVEVGINAYLIRDTGRRIIWSVAGKLSHNKNEIKKIDESLQFLNENLLEENQYNPSFLYKEGESINTIYAVKSQGIDPSNGKELFRKANGELTYTWDARDEVACGVQDPKIWGNFNTTFSYKNLSLTAIFSFRHGGQYYNQTLVDKVENILPYYNADRRALYERWSEPGKGAAFKNIRDYSVSTKASSRFVMDESTLHCSNLSFEYELDFDWFRKNLGISYLTVGGNMEDVFRISTIKQERGLNYPFSRKFSFSVSARF